MNSKLNIEKILEEGIGPVIGSNSSMGTLTNIPTAKGIENKFSPTRVSIVDIIQVADHAQEEITNGILPFQIDSSIQLMVDAYNKNDDIKKLFIDCLEHPLVKEDDVRIKIIKKIVAKLNGISKAYKDIAEDMDYLNLNDN